MSDTVRSYGYMAELISPLSSDQHGLIQDALYDINSELKINDEGTLVYADYNSNKSYAERAELYGLMLGRDKSMPTPDEFQTLCRIRGLHAKPDTIHPYSCIWYNGTDSDMSTLTLAEFRERVQA